MSQDSFSEAFPTSPRKCTMSSVLLDSSDPTSCATDSHSPNGCAEQSPVFQDTILVTTRSSTFSAGFSVYATAPA